MPTRYRTSRSFRSLVSISVTEKAFYLFMAVLACSSTDRSLTLQLTSAPTIKDFPGEELERDALNALVRDDPHLRLVLKLILYS